MAAIDIGPGATDRASSDTSGWTLLDYSNPANDTGNLTSFEFWFAGGSSNTARVGTFFGSGTDWESRDSELISSIHSGSKQTYTGKNCDCVVNDVLGIYFTGSSASIEMSGGGDSGYVIGTTFGGGQYTYTDTSYTYSVYATGSTDALESASESPSKSPSESPSISPSKSPSLSPSASKSPSRSPSISASRSPSESPSTSPSESPSLSPSISPSVSPSISPSLSPSASISPSVSPSISPSASLSPSASPSEAPWQRQEEEKIIYPITNNTITYQELNSDIVYLRLNSDIVFTKK